jgi:integrase/recombinase XerD
MPTEENAVTIYTGNGLGTVTQPSHYMTIATTIAAWLDAKSKRTDSAKTKRAYADTITQFRGLLQSAGLDLDSESAIVATAAQGYAGRTVSEGKDVSGATFNQRLAILSSFYTYAQKHSVLERNPIGLVERRPTNHKDAAMPLDSFDVQERLQAIDRTELQGLRDYVLLSVLLVTGRRANELAALRYGDIRFTGKKASVTWTRCKGGKVMHDELPAHTSAALLSYLHKVYGRALSTLDRDTPIWVSCSRHNQGKAISAQAIADICLERLGTSKIHATRHTFAVMMEQAGASLSDIGARLGHSDLKTTSDYMKRLHSAENAYAGKLESLFGI